MLWSPLALALPLAFARQSTNEPSLLVRGETTFTSDQSSLAWRVVRDVAEVGSAAAFERRALGFAVATEPFGMLLLTDELTGSAYRLAPGEAAFVRDGTLQRRESLGDSAQSYMRIGLVAATEASDAGGDWPIFAGTAFAAPAGPLTLSLSRAELSEGDSTALPSGRGEQLILVEQGEVELEVGEAAPRELLRTTVGSDTSYAVRSIAASAMLYGARDATSVLLAILS
jgi:hypothetical protein